MPQTKKAEQFNQATIFMFSSHPSYNVLATYNTLLSTLSNQEENEEAQDEFDRLYQANYSSFQRLQELQKQNLDSMLTLAKLYSKKEKYDLRKNSILSNIEWHFSSNEISFTSILIIIGLACAMCATVVGLLTIPLVYNTVAIFLPIMLLTLGFIGLINGIIAAVLDKKHAVASCEQIDRELQNIDSEKNARNLEAMSLFFKESEGSNVEVSSLIQTPSFI